MVSSALTSKGVNRTPKPDIETKNIFNIFPLNSTFPVLYCAASLVRYCSVFRSAFCQSERSFLRKFEFI